MELVRLIIKKIKELLPFTNLITGEEYLVVYDPVTDATYKVKVSSIRGGQSTLEKWSPDSEYDEGKILEWNLKIWQSLTDNNQGNIPTEGTFWTEVSRSEAANFGYYAPGVFTNDPTIVLNNGSLYWLDNTVVSLPFNSTDFAAELAANKWKSITGSGGGGGGLTPEQEATLTAAGVHINGADDEKHGSNQITNAAALAKLGTAANAKVSTILGAVENAVVPVVVSGEKVVTRTPTEILVSTDMVEQIVAPGTIAAADWTLDQATYPGLTGQITYDETYKYECKGLNTWVRYDITLRNYIDLYLAGIDDSTGERTDAQLNAAFPSALIGQMSYGSDFYLYEKITSTMWRRFDHGKFFIRRIDRSAVTANTTFTIPLGFKIDSLIIKNNTANAVTINIGTTTGGTDVLNGLVVGANVVIDATLLILFFSTTAGTTLYFESDNWNSANLDFKVLIKRAW